MVPIVGAPTEDSTSSPTGRKLPLRKTGTSVLSGRPGILYTGGEVWWWCGGEGGGGSGRRWRGKDVKGVGRDV